MSKILNHQIYRFDTLTSTNVKMEELCQAGKIENGAVVLSAFQTKGRGVMHTEWESEIGKNLLLSYYFDCQNLSFDDQFFISKATAIAVCEAIEQITGMNLCQVKWPNDLYINQYKLGGILIQNSTKNQKIQYSIIGIGLNINQSSFDGDFNATSLKLETGQEINQESALSILLSKLDHWLALVKKNEFDNLDAKYHEMLLGLQKKMKYRIDNQILSAEIQKINRQGQLVLKMESGEIRKFEMKEISLAEW